MPSVFVQLACEALGTDHRTVAVVGTEAMNALPRWEVHVLTPAPDLDSEAIVGATATLSLVDEIEGSVRVIGLVVTDVAFQGVGRDGAHWSVTLSSLAWFTTLRSGYRVFLDKTTKEIVDEMLADAGVPADRLVWRLSGAYQPRLQTVQYDESDWAFVTRLLADDGISHWFDDLDDQGPVLVLADDAGSHDGILGEGVVPYEDPGGTFGHRTFYGLSVTRVAAHTAVSVRDYDVRAPAVFIEGEAGEGTLEHFEYPACVLDSDAAAQRAQVRLEQLQRFALHAEAVGNCIRIQPGRVVEIAGCTDDWMNGKYLVVGAEHEVAAGTRADVGGTPYMVRAIMVPAEAMAHRPDIPRRIPRASGVEPAFTTGPPGEEIHVDDLGRLKLRFPWDRSGIEDDTSSYWARCLQANMGAAMALPRVGWEVPVAYIDGNPDRPFVLGRAYNGTAILPYGLPGGAATTTFQSATSPGDGTTNELRVGDSGGGQEMFLHATRDQTVTVGGSATTSVDVDETHDINLALLTTIGASQSHTVGSNQSLNVGTSYVTNVAGSRSEMIGAMESIKVTANRVVAIKGAYNELVGALYGLQCNQANYTIKGAYTQLIGGTLAIQAGMGTSQTVAAARSEVVGGSRTINASRGMSASVIGAMAVTAGATKESAGGDWEVQVKAARSMTVGASAKIGAGGAVVFEAPQITVDVSGKIKAGAMQIGGGKLKAKSGTTGLKGT
ncbi:MAG: type VI secretion system tip protein TssI/VgrG, partial [Polyangiaceae bacterium]